LSIPFLCSIPSFIHSTVSFHSIHFHSFHSPCSLPKARFDEARAISNSDDEARWWCECCSSQTPPPRALRTSGYREARLFRRTATSHQAEKRSSPPVDALHMLAIVRDPDGAEGRLDRCERPPPSRGEFRSRTPLWLVRFPSNLGKLSAGSGPRPRCSAHRGHPAGPTLSAPMTSAPGRRRAIWVPLCWWTQVDFTRRCCSRARTVPALPRTVPRAHFAVPAPWVETSRQSSGRNSTLLPTALLAHRTGSRSELRIRSDAASTKRPHQRSCSSYDTRRQLDFRQLIIVPPELCPDERPGTLRTAERGQIVLPALRPVIYILAEHGAGSSQDQCWRSLLLSPLSLATHPVCDAFCAGSTCGVTT
jgi:hypothetical protein